MNIKDMYIVQELRYYMGQPRGEGWRDKAAFQTIEQARKWIHLFGSFNYDYRILPPENFLN